MGISDFLQTVDNYVWGPPLLLLLIGTGLYLTIRLKMVQIFKLPLALKFIFEKDKEKEEDGVQGDVSNYGSLCTAISATIGTGNIVGIATAVQAGGPGALFWMWVASSVGMATKYAEAVLAIKYREVNANNQMVGGPMYYIQNGLKKKWLAKIFAIFGVVVALVGIGTFGQVKSISHANQILFDVPIWITAAVVTIIVAMITLGGIQRIASVAEKIVPAMVLFYVGGAIVVLFYKMDAIIPAFATIIESAFYPESALGGILGVSVQQAIQRGVGRGIYSNEAGMGSAPIAVAAAKTKSAVKQGLISMGGVFFSLILCSMTGIVLVLSQSYLQNVEGAAMTTHAFEAGLPFPGMGKYVVNLGLIFFAFTTILGWNYYGEKCMEYLAGVKSVLPYRLTFIALVGVGSFLPLGLIFIIADIVNGLMAVPNLIGIIGLRKVIISETNAFFSDEDKNMADL